MIEELRIQNFQVHGKLVVKFGPGITTIVGPSDTGKSAIIRALRWVATNQPGGDAFVRYGAKGCTVRVVVDGRHVTRKRKAGGDVNTYHLDDQEYKAFGRGVPDTIAEFLNLPGVCWQGQHDPSFWFGDTPGEVSRQLNAIVDLGVIDVTLTNVARTFTKARNRLDVAEENLTTAKANAEDTKWAVECGEALSIVERKYGDAYAAAGRAVQARAAYEAVVTHQAVVKRAQGRVRAMRPLFTRAEAARALRKDHQRVFLAIVAAEKAEKVVSASELDFGPVRRAAGVYSKTKFRIGKLERLIKLIEVYEERLCQKRIKLQKKRAALPKSCPTCGASLPQTST